MFCPRCRDEFRPGFERCGRCDVDLVHELGEQTPQRSDAGPKASAVRVAEYCGFISLDEARDARGRLREAGIVSDIVIREVQATQAGDDLHEEFWLRADRSRLKEVPIVLGDTDDDDADDEAGFRCSDCDSQVPDDAAVCPGCGASFEG